MIGQLGQSLVPQASGVAPATHSITAAEGQRQVLPTGEMIKQQNLDKPVQEEGRGRGTLSILSAERMTRDGNRYAQLWFPTRGRIYNLSFICAMATKINELERTLVRRQNTIRNKQAHISKQRFLCLSRQAVKNP